MKVGCIAGAPRIARPCWGSGLALRADIAAPSSISMLRRSSWSPLRPHLQTFAKWRHPNRRKWKTCCRDRAASIIRGKREVPGGEIERP
jgi:hypothetical protein